MLLCFFQFAEVHEQFVFILGRNTASGVPKCHLEADELFLQLGLFHLFKLVVVEDLLVGSHQRLF